MSDEWIKETNEFSRQMARDEFERARWRSNQRKEYIQNALMFFAVVIVVAGSVAAIWRLSVVKANPAEIACIEAGGTWTSVGQNGNTCWWFTRAEVTP